MSEFHTEADAPIVGDARTLRDAPPGSVIVTGSGHRYVKTVAGYWTCPGVTARATARRLLDPEGTRPPLRMLYMSMGDGHHVDG